VDLRLCTACGGRLRIVGAVVDPRAARRILERLDLHTRAPPVVRARDPTELDAVEESMTGEA